MDAPVLIRGAHQVCERPVCAPTWPDEQLEYWAEQYLARPALARRMTFVAFIEGQARLRGSLLLPEQIDLRADLAALERSAAELRRTVAVCRRERVRRGRP